MKYVHTNLVCKDWRRLSSFYVETFDCQVKPPVRKQSGEWLDRGTGVIGASLEGVHLLLPGYGQAGPTLEIYQYEEIENMPECLPNARGFGHIAFEVDDVEKVLERLVLNGGRKCGEISNFVISDVGEISFVYARDPEGNLIEIQHWK